MVAVTDIVAEVANADVSSIRVLGSIAAKMTANSGVDGYIAGSTTTANAMSIIYGAKIMAKQSVCATGALRSR
jgi:hypothetical protein